jgi:hypothetical protein
MMTCGFFYVPSSRRAKHAACGQFSLPRPVKQHNTKIPNKINMFEYKVHQGFQSKKIASSWGVNINTLRQSNVAMDNSPWIVASFSSYKPPFIEYIYSP